MTVKSRVKSPVDMAKMLLIGLVLVTDVVGECVTTVLTNALQRGMGNERSSASAVVTFL